MTRPRMFIAVIGLLFAGSMSLSALPPRPPETPAEKAFRQAGFTTTSEVGCCWSIIIYKAAPTVSDADLKSIIDPGIQFVLDLSGSRITNAGIKELPHFAKLYRLNLRDTQATPLCLKDLGQFPEIPVLFSAAQVTADAAQALAKEAPSRCMLQIEPLNDDVFRVLGDAGQLHLLTQAAGKNPWRAPSDAAITSLTLWPGEISDSSTKYLARMPIMEYLNVGSCPITDAGLKDIASLNHLQHVDLVQTKITDAGLKNLAGLKELKLLNIAGTSITGAALKYFVHHANLEILLNDSAIDAQGMSEVAKEGMPSWILTCNPTDDTLHALAKVGMLHLLADAKTGGPSRPKSEADVISFRGHSSMLTAAGITELTAFKNLQELELRFLRCGDEVVPALSGLDELTKLNLNYCNITDVGLQILESRTKLKTLGIRKTKVTKEGIVRLQQALPDCKIEH